MQRRYRYAAIAAVALAGYGTLYNHEVGPCPKSRRDTMRVYGGVRKDIEVVHEKWQTSKVSQQPD